MGIEIHLRILPDRITPEEWASVYQETLKILDHFDFMDVVKGKYGMYFAKRTQHRENLCEEYGGWHSGGDLVTGWNTEDFYFFDNIDHYRDSHSKDTGKDILLTYVHDGDIPEAPDAAFVFGAKTQGRYSHIPLLAVACLVTHRFPHAALVCGDITDGQCEEAVEWANHFLDTPIAVPYTADMTKLVPRFLNAGLPDDMILDLVFHSSIQAKDAVMGAYLKKHLSANQINSYYSKYLLFRRHGEDEWQLSFPLLKQYLEMSFDFRELCRIVLTDPERKQSPESFLNTLLDMKLHIEIDKKNLFDISANPEETGDRKKVGSVNDQLFRVFAMMHGARNRNVNAYLPLEQIKKDMCTVLDGDNFAATFDDIVAKHTKPGEGSAQTVLYDNPKSKYYLDKFPTDRACEAQKSEQEEEYDITNQYQVIKYKHGATIQPDIRKRLEDNLATISTFADDFFPEFIAYNKELRIKWFKKALKIHILEETMDMIVDNIMDNDFIRKYVCLCLVDLNSSSVELVVRSFLWNKALLNDFWQIVTDRTNESIKPS